MAPIVPLPTPPRRGIWRVLRRPGLTSEAARKAIHVGFLILPLALLHRWLPWPDTRGEWRLLLIGLVLVAITIDVARLHERRVRQFFRSFFGELLREHERFNLLGSTYLLLAALLAVELFPRPMAAAAIGFTVVGDAAAALVGRAIGRTRFFGKTLEGALGGLVACLAWGGFLLVSGFLPWNVVLIGALVASLVELLPIPLDDNLGITLFSGYAMKLLGGSA
jgi:dolichol kinase